MTRSFMVRWSVVVSLGCFGVVAVACSSSDDSNASSSSSSSSSGSSGDAAMGDSATPTDAPADTASPTDSGQDTSMGMCTQPPDAGAACNTIVQTGTDVALTNVGGATPTGTGGTIADGRYHTTAVTAYAGSPATGITLKQTWEFCQNRAGLIGDEPGKPQYRKLFRFATNGNQVTSTNECTTQSPNVEVPFDSYTATPTTLTLYASSLAFSVTITKE